MVRASPSTSLGVLSQRLLEYLQFRIASGELTVRGLAREIGISEPHMHNLVNGKRALTTEMADRLLQFLDISALDLATELELGGALERVAPNPRLVRFVPLLAGLLGPAHPFPELDACGGWIALPVHTVSHVRQPVFVELGADGELATDFPAARFALLDTARPARLLSSPDAWYAVRWSGGGWVRRLRRESGRLIVLGQTSLRATIEPWRIELTGTSLDAHVQGQVVWLGEDPRAANPLGAGDYLIPPPAADS